MWDFLQSVSERDLLVACLLFVISGLSCAVLTLYRRNGLLVVLLERANARAISASNETSRVVLHSFAAAVRPLLSDLESDSVNDWELMFDPPDEEH